MRKTAASRKASQRRTLGFLPVALVAVFWLAVFAIPIGLVAHGAYSAVLQHRLIQSARPVVATVVSSRLVEARARRGRRTTLPVVVFRYEVDSRMYQSDQTMVLARRGRPDGMTPQQFVASLPPGKTVEAYHVPNEPWRAFLLKKYNEGPYVAMYCGLGLLALMLSSGLAYSFIPTRASPAGRDWHPLGARRPLHSRVRLNLGQGVVYLSIWGWASWHYFSHVPPPHGVAGHLITLIVGMPGLWYLVSSARARFTRRAVSDARVAIHGRAMGIGEEARVRVEQDLRHDAVLEHVRVGLVCEKTTGSGKYKATEVHWQTWASPTVLPMRPDVKRKDGRSVLFDCTFSVPRELPPSRPMGDPKYAWKVVVETSLAGWPDYHEEFELQVRAAAEPDAPKRGPRKLRKRRRQAP